MAVELKQQVDEGITTHKAMARDLPAWLDEYETLRMELDPVMNENTICNRRNWIRQKLRALEDLEEKVSTSVYNFSDVNQSKTNSFHYIFSIFRSRRLGN